MFWGSKYEVELLMVLEFIVELEVDEVALVQMWALEGVMM